MAQAPIALALFLRRLGRVVLIMLRKDSSKCLLPTRKSCTIFDGAMPADLADALLLSPTMNCGINPNISPAMLATVVQEFDEAQAVRLLNLISTDQAVQLITEMSADTVDMLQWLTDDLRPESFRLCLQTASA